MVGGKGRVQKSRCNADRKTSLCKLTKKGKGTREGGGDGEEVYIALSILHFAIPIPVLQSCIVSIAANGRSVSSRSTRFVALTSPSDRD